MKKFDTQNQKEFIQFLSTQIFKEPILSFYQFKRGASSFNYLVTLKDKKLLVKLTWKYKEDKLTRLVQVLQILTQQNSIPLAKIIPFKNQIIFKYKKFFGFVLEYIDGKSLPAYYVKKNHIYQILNAYKSFQQTTFKNEKLLIPACNFKQQQETYLKNCDSMIQESQNSFLTKFLLKICRKELIALSKTPLLIDDAQKDIIHGDFHHNNMLFKNNKLKAILDFEAIGFGYATEDLLRFGLCLIARQQIFYPSKKFFINYINIITNEFSYSYEKWLVGLNSFTLHKMKKVFAYPQKPSLELTKKLIHIILFMRKYHTILSLLKKKTQ